MGGLAPAILASCAGLPAPISEAIASAPVVFVGVVTGTSDDGRTATVHVDELWRGPVLPHEVTLHGSPEVSAAATSVDRHYENGKRYLFMPNNGGGSDFIDNSCSMTREFSSDLGAYRPATARHYPPAPHGPPFIPLAAGAVLLITAAVGAVVLRRNKAARLRRDTAADEPETSAGRGYTGFDDQ
jgi:hypothetical protein